jgi:hypothetical protein
VTDGPISIKLVDLHKDAVVNAVLHVGLSDEQIRRAQAEWEPVRKESIARLHNEGHPLEELPKHWGWDWTRKISRLGNPLLGFYDACCRSGWPSKIAVLDKDAV